MAWLELCPQIESSDYFPNRSNEDSHVDVSGNGGKYHSDMWDVAVYVDSGKSGSAQVVIYDDWLFDPDRLYDRVEIQFEVNPLTLKKVNSNGDVYWTARLQVFKKVGSEWQFQAESSPWVLTANHEGSYTQKVLGVDYSFASGTEYKIRLRVSMSSSQTSGGTVLGEADFEVPNQTGWLRFRYST